MRHVREIIVAVATLAGVAGVLALNPNGPQPAAPAAAGSQPGGVAGSSASAPENSGDSAEDPTGESTAPEAVREVVPEPATRTHTGAEYPTKWGSIQVVADVTDGVLVDISFVSLPQDSRSARINESAAPVLVEEALASQSAEVDTISGATYTSEGFRYSLLSVLEQAGL